MKKLLLLLLLLFTVQKNIQSMAHFYEVLHYKEYMTLNNGDSIGWITVKSDESDKQFSKAFDDDGKKVLINVGKNKEPRIDMKTRKVNFFYINPDVPIA